MNALSYPRKIEVFLKDKYGDLQTNETRHVVEIKGTKYTVTHTVFRFEVDGRKKTVIVEGRGNDPWVPAIEGNRVDQLGASLVADSLEASKAAMEGAQRDFGSDEDLAGIFRNLARRAPDCSMLCCTHYPPMMEPLRNQYDAMGGGVTDFINQAAVVREVAKQLDVDAVAPEKGPLELVVTVGSQNRSGASASIERSIADGDATANSLYKVLDMTLAGEKGNDAAARGVGSVRIFSQEHTRHGDETAKIDSLDTIGTLQRQFEYVHQFIGLPISSRILAEQGLSGEFALAGDGNPVLKSVKPLKENLLTVDGRRLGSVEQARLRHEDHLEAGREVPLGVGPTGMEGADNDTTHNDALLKYKNALL